jgi:hypothetical protein
MRPHRYLLISLLLLPPSSVLALRHVTFVNSPSKSSSSSLRRVYRHEQSCRKRLQKLGFIQSSVIKFNTSTQRKISFSPSDDINGWSEIINILRKYGFGNRLVTLTNTDLSQRPILAEIYAESRMNICLLIRWVLPSASSLCGYDKPPLLEVLVRGDDGMFKDKKVIDIGEDVHLFLVQLMESKSHIS